MSAPKFRLRTTSLNSLRLRRIFDLFDRNHDGKITPEELGLALRQLGLDADLGELEVTIAAYIKPGTGGLEYEDFEELHRSLGDALFGWEKEGVNVEQEESDLSEAFKVFDEDGDGFISASELQTVLGKLGLPEGREIEQVRQMICSVDLNKDGRVDFVEFKYMMQGITVRTS